MRKYLCRKTSLKAHSLFKAKDDTQMEMAEIILQKKKSRPAILETLCFHYRFLRPTLVKGFTCEEKSEEDGNELESKFKIDQTLPIIGCVTKLRQAGCMQACLLDDQRQG